ncbi:MAG: indole-3-glycerol phosphate synthase [SAR202 cluster bacterium Casp-Chloro-G4]|nr:indole-3-glycerol phosphate synthase TrpC [Chloroflexota bacterium]MDA1227602.1 indole-3-glycerol phosphate synthase TrpC [Chloroflexota bacterium]PKB60991.1 MAG: indole-3-glycerol phosphate synthase [SAR202 cluster bacterium Casp-Chloro-G4]
MVQGGTPDILKKIVGVKRVEVERLKIEMPLAELQRRIAARQPALDFADALRGDPADPTDKVKIIAEVKKASPSKGLLRADFDAVDLAKTYVANGAAAISVLTEVDHFQGSIDYMAAVQEVAYPHNVPVLRKEFIFDTYQVYEARAYGADALLLIVAMLSPECLVELFDLSGSLGMQCLVEVHDESEVDVALKAGADVVGINNRDLRTFITDLSVTERLATRVPSDKIIISESGINSPKDLVRVQAAGANAALIGEALVTASDVGAKLRELA